MSLGTGVILGGSGAALVGGGFEIVEPMGADAAGPWQPTSTIKSAIVQNLRSILLVEPGEWIVRPRVGSPLPALIDDPATERNLALVRATVRAAVERHEPRYNLIPAGVTAEYESRTVTENAQSVRRVYLVVTLKGNILDTGESLTVTLAASYE